ncbi:hypothetical protein [Arthrobacter sp. ISL-95]|uniref:hypothetical protein n=1 Tax=Arthrobacter sp. ISL-95 TaxID=2819116 RepID=UPI001BE7D010|nr:hypothetical protein [Arthrobacter sp. ISL-95]MBT2587966.1 hypothetical protein [Arthrobacter sp. ISL-95]
MIFWILLALVIAGAVTTFVCTLWDGPFGAILMSLLALVGGGFIGFLLWAGSYALIQERDHAVVGESTQQLRALGNASGLEGRSYFLGGGYIEDKRVLNYITQSEDGAIRVERSDASDSTIYEGSETATVNIKVVDASNPWISPWPLDTKYIYEFRIPSGSVVESYALENK